ncbi:MAG: ROK family protein, partial [Atopobium sp.]|nr:ROK family protein [Atopobium sp.]
LSTPKQGWRNFNLLQALKDGLNVPVGYDTDVNAACLGEAVFGAARSLDNVVYLTVGTGIGAGVLLEGKLQHGMLPRLVISLLNARQMILGSRLSVPITRTALRDWRQVLLFKSAGDFQLLS